MISIWVISGLQTPPDFSSIHSIRPCHLSALLWSARLSFLAPPLAPAVGASLGLSAPPDAVLRRGLGLSSSPSVSQKQRRGVGGAHSLRLGDSPFILNSQRQRAGGWSGGARAGPPTACRAGGAAGPDRAGGRAAGARSGARAAWAPGWRAPRGGERACVCVRARGRPAFSVTGATKKGRVREREGGAAAAPGASPHPPPGQEPPRSGLGPRRGAAPRRPRPPDRPE